MGSRLGFSQLMAPSPGDFLPPAPTLGESSLALLPPGTAGLPTGWQGTGRPTLNQSVDLITGVEFYQTNDLELPFDGATFRLTRTRSSTPPAGFGVNGLYGLGESDRWWDWTGLGWMVGENPLLIVDSAVPDIVGNRPRMSWLILDAHHSIPFQLIESTGLYEAPPRFRARMSVIGGTWNATTRSWSVRPRGYRVSLYDGQLHYTFAAMNEDVPPNKWDDNYLHNTAMEPEPDIPSSYHDRPFLPNQFHDADGSSPFLGHDPYTANRNPGVGVPYFGLCTRIEDNYGHTVRINYCDSTRTSIDYVDGGGTGDCVECQQNCLSKGQIRTVTLESDGEVLWTLLYSHRQTRGDKFEISPINPELWWLYEQYPEALEANARIYEMHGHSVIDRIYVYEGAADLSALPAGSCLNVSHLDNLSADESGCVRGNLDAGADALAVFNAQAGMSDLPTNWRHMVRYHYQYNVVGPSPIGQVLGPPLLLKRTCITRPTAGSETTNEQVYVYKGVELRYSTAPVEESVYPLRAVFTDHDLEVLSAAIVDPDGAGPQQATLSALPEWFDINVLATQLNPRLTGYSCDQYEFLTETNLNMVLPFASKRFEHNAPPTWPQGPDVDMPSSWVMDEYFSTVPIDRVINNTHDTAVTCTSLRGDDGAARHYRVHRLMVHPQTEASYFETTTPAPFYTSMNWDPYTGTGHGVGSFDRSVLVSPYFWQGYGGQGSQSDWSLSDNPPSLQEPRWVAIVDEFPTREEMMAIALYDGAWGVKPGQMNRRVVEMNAAGYVLKDRTWRFREGPNGLEVEIEGGGLGEHYVYKTVEELFGQVAAPSTTPPDTVEIGDADLEIPAYDDQYRELLRELLLVQHCSVGWSAAGGSQATQGLVRFNEYAWFDEAQEDVPLRERVQLVAQGVQRGSGTTNPKLYTRQLMRRDDVPTDVLAEINFFSPPTTLLTTVPPLVELDPVNPYPYTYAFTRFDVAREEPVGETKPESEWRVTSRTVTATPRQVYPGSKWYYPVEHEIYDEAGNSLWAAQANVIDPTDPSADATDPWQSVTLTYYHRDDQGRPQYTVMDASAGTHTTPGGGSVVVPAPPGPWGRVPATTGLNYITEFLYDEFGLSDTLFPNGRRWARRYVQIDQPGGKYFMREFVFNDLVAGAQAGEFAAESPGEVKDYGRQVTGAPRVTRKVEFTDPVIAIDSITQLTQPNYEEYWVIQVAPDANGRIARAELLEPDSTGALLPVGSKEVNDLGEMYRQRDIDGTITRQTKNALGHVLRTYVGTEDDKWSDPQQTEDNMVLVERLEYGIGVKDAWLPTITRKYRSQPSWGGREHAFDPPPPSDTDGYATKISYDWRMRPVRTDEYAKGDIATATRLSTTLTFLDHLDRPVLVVNYGDTMPSLPSSLDPTALVDNDAIPAARAFYDYTPKPLSIIGTVYAPDGNKSEDRIYNVSWTPPGGGGGTPTALVSRYCTGQGGQQLYSQQPQQPIQITKLDSLGRPSWTASVVYPSAGGVHPEFGTAYGYELTRTEYTYDPNGNVVDTARWERVVDDTTDVLSASNAVKTRSVSWYDVQKRVIASADLGTEVSTFSQPGVGFTPYTRSLTAPSWDKSTNTINRGTLPASAQLTINVYDRYGNRTDTVDPRGAVTTYAHGRAGRMSEMVENALDTDANLRRATKYTYQYGRLIKSESRRSNTVSGYDAWQPTTVEYGAAVVDESFAVVSANNGLIAKMIVPSETTGSNAEGVTFRYDFSGRVVERRDERGVVFRYGYDTEDRLASITIGYYSSPGGAFVVGHPSDLAASTGAPVDRVGYVAYTYDNAGRLSDIEARIAPGDRLITHNRYTYDARGNVLQEYQSFGTAVTASTPATAYAWTYLTTGTSATQLGYDRLSTISYPNHQFVSPRRVVSMGYGTSGSVDQRLARLKTISTSANVAYTAAQFGYAGIGRRASLSMGGGAVSQVFNTAAGVGLEGLDQFGRVADLHYKSAALPVANTLFRGQYAYDVAGNRTAAVINQVNVTGQDVNRRSQLHSYDGLNRLKDSTVGEVTFVSGVPTLTPGTTNRTDAWTLDLLGNWAGGAPRGLSATIAGRASTGNLDNYGYTWQLPGADAAADDGGFLAAHNNQNEITQLQNTNPGAVPSAATGMRYDRANNLIYDGTYIYQYDAWGRLAQVNLADGSPTGNPGTQDNPYDYLPVGAMVKHYTYDGLGRLVRVQSPYPEVAEDNELVRSERFYYDGTRRVQEIYTDPVLSARGAAMSGNPDTQEVFGASYSPTEQADISATPLALEQGLLTLVAAEAGVVDVMPQPPPELEAPIEFEVADEVQGLPYELPGEGDGGAGGGEMMMMSGATGGGGGGTGTTTSYLHREYIWGVNNAAGTEELLVQFDDQRKPWWTLQDGGGDVVALVKWDTVNVQSQVASQWTYDAYGQVLTADHILAAPINSAGHKAMFVDRLDVGVGETGADSPRLVPYAHMLVQAGARTYAPGLGRFLQPDPNATAIALIGASASQGRGIPALIATLSLDERMGDGANLYEYLGSNPWERSDHLGLSWDPFDMVDEYLAETAGNTAAFLSALGKDTLALAVVAAQIASYLPFPGASLAGDLALVVMGEQSAGSTAMALAVGLIPGGKLASLVGKMAASAWKAVSHYASKYAAPLARAVVKGLDPFGVGRWLFSKAKAWVGRKPASACHCFVAGTLVLTPAGTIPIEDLEVGGLVIAVSESSPQHYADTHQIVAVVATENTAPLYVVLEHANGQIEQLVTTDSHPFRLLASTRAISDEWARADSLRPTDVIETLSGYAVVLSLSFGSERVAVYDLEVRDAHTYMVGDQGVIVHNCNLVQPLGRGNTGRVVPNSLNEQLAMEQVMSNPGGRHLKNINMTDSRWPGVDGWEKWSHDVNGVEIHYVRQKTFFGDQFDDFKYK
jgi:YD repeat-containing protein